MTLEARIGNTRTPLKVDITSGDIITPKEVVYRFDLLLENRSIDVLAYNIETVLAEKIETLLSRGIANTRMRDFYDLYILIKLRSENVNPSILTEAVAGTAERRGTSDLLSQGEIILAEVFKNEDLPKQWKKYQKEYSYAEDISWKEIKEVVYLLWSMIEIK